MSRTRQLVKEELIRVATQCFSNQGYQDTTLADICSQVNISRVTFYTYFESKAALLKTIFERLVTAYKQKLVELLAKPLPPLEKLHQGVTLQITSLTTEQPLIRLLFQEEASLPKEAASVVQKVQQEIEHLMEEEIKNGIQRGELIDENPYLLMQAFRGMCNWAYRWYQPEGPITPEEMIRVFARILESGMLTSKAQTENGDLSRSLQQMEKSLQEVQKELGRVSQHVHVNAQRPHAQPQTKGSRPTRVNSAQRRKGTARHVNPQVTAQKPALVSVKPGSLERNIFTQWVDPSFLVKH